MGVIIVEKMRYERPTLEVEKFELEDIITRSGPGRLPSEEEDDLLAE